MNFTILLGLLAAFGGVAFNHITAGGPGMQPASFVGGGPEKSAPNEVVGGGPAADPTPDSFVGGGPG